MFTYYSPADIAELLDAAKSAKVPIMPRDIDEQISKKDSNKLHFKALTQYCQVRRLEAGAVLFEPDEIGREAYVVIQGAAEITIGDKIDRIIREGEIFGESGLAQSITRKERSAFITDGMVLVVTPENLLSVINTEPSLGYKMVVSLLKHISDSEIKQA